MIFEGRWNYCLECDTVAIRCPECGILSCTGGGCPACDKDFNVWMEMLAAGTIPDKDTIPKVGMTIEELDRFFHCTMPPEELEKIKERNKGLEFKPKPIL